LSAGRSVTYRAIDVRIGTSVPTTLTT